MFNIQNHEELKNIIKALSSQNTFKYPLESLKGGYLETLEKRIDEYVKRVEELNLEYISISREQEEVNPLVKIKDYLIEIIRLYLSGNIEEAYNKFSILINMNRHHIENLMLHIENGEEVFYRVRYSEKEISSKEEIFHVPFDKRHLVSTMRYSIAGVPCLYLGNSIYDCWLEMDKPELNKLYISKFKNTESISIIDFAITLDTLYKEPTIHDQNPNQYTFNKVNSFLTIYPLILACSFKKLNENAKFNIEYILPNMLLQWISREKEHISGIRYFSTKMHHKRYDSIGINIVFPPKKNKDSLKGFCPYLKNLFSFTAPISWSMINNFPLINLNDRNIPRITNDTKILQSSDEVIDSHYKMTKFYQIEQNIDNYFEFLKLDDKQRPERINLWNDLF